MARTSIFNAILNPSETRASRAKNARSASPYVHNYENRLRLIGLRIDNMNMCRPVIIEVPGGMLLRAEHSDTITDELLEFPDDQFARQYEEATQLRAFEDDGYLRIKTDLIPTSYSDVFRAIGQWLDDGLARSVVIAEGKSGLYISGKMLEETSIQSRYAPFDELFTPDAVDMLLTNAQARRNGV